jgi:predicted O-methyltransferase YrrM
MSNNLSRYPQSFTEKQKNIVDQIDAETAAGKKYWQISRETALILHDFILKQKLHSGLEIGTSSGYSGIFFADALAQNKGQLITLESNKFRFDLAGENFAKSGTVNIVQIFGHAPEALIADDQKDAKILVKEHFCFQSIFNEAKVDFLFIDCTKKNYLETFLAAEKFLLPQAQIIFDNVISHADKVQDLLAFAKENSNYQSEVYDIGTGLLHLARPEFFEKITS